MNKSVHNELGRLFYEKLFNDRIYINQKKEIKIVSYKKTKIGYYLASEPYIIISQEQWNEVAKHIIYLMNEIRKQPITDETKTNVIEKISGIKSFKQFSKKHICIEVILYEDDTVFEISHQPRLSDGSYGTQKDLTEEYSRKYNSSENDILLLQENFMKAYIDAQHYLKKIGSELYNGCD